MLQSLDPILNLAKRRGFFFQSAEIYGGTGGVFDMGPLGVELNNNIKQLWWKRFVQQRNDVVGIDGAILTIATVLKASGHVDGFSDPLIECNNCHIRLRSDHYLEEDNARAWITRWIDEATKQRGSTSKKDEPAALEAAQAFFDFSNPDSPILRTGVTYKEFVCPNPDCRKLMFGEPRQFNMMFETHLGPVQNDGTVAYLRPETAQSIFINFKNILDTNRKKLPFGIAQIGKAFRNEITVGNSLFRVRELEQMEIEFFVKPGEDEKWHEHWIEQWNNFIFNDLGLTKENVRPLEISKDSLAHYSKRTVDIEYNYPFGGWGELTGIANRTDYDLKNHQEHSGKDLTYFDEVTHERYIPYVIEPSMGVGRALLAVLIDAYKEYPEGRDGKGESETVLHIAKALAPIKVAVLPLMKKDGLAEKAQEVFKVVGEQYMSQYDESGAIGRRYRRQDEIGTPYCITIDYDTLQDGTVTIRDRDTMKQKRIKIEEIVSNIEL